MKGTRVGGPVNFDRDHFCIAFLAPMELAAHELGWPRVPVLDEA